MSVDLVAFLLARLAELEETASRAGGSVWHVRGEGPSRGLVVEGDGLMIYDEGGHDEYQAAHIARHSPENVLADVASKHRLIELAFQHAATIDGEWGCCHTSVEIRAGQCHSTHPNHMIDLQLLAIPFAVHPDYREEWKP